MKRLCVAVWSAFLLSLSVPADAIEVGPEFVLPDSGLAPIPVVPHYGDMYGKGADGRISGSSCGDGYLAVWGGKDGGVHAARLSLAGDLAEGSPWLLSEEGNSPSVATNGDGCLVVWAPTAWPTAIVGVRLSSAGEVLDGEPIVVASGNDASVFPSVLVTPSVSAAGADYLVSWYVDEYVNKTAGAVVSAEGEVLARFGLFASPEWDTSWAIWTFDYGGSFYFLNESTSILAGPGSSGAMCLTVPALPAPLCAFVNMQTATTASPLATAYDGTRFLLLFNTNFWYGQDHPESAPGLRAAWFPETPEPHSGPLDSIMLEPHDVSAACPGQPTCMYRYEPFPVVAGFDGRSFMAIWFTGEAGASHAFGALLPPTSEGAAPVKEPLFSTSATVPALASSGRGTSLLLYASPSAADPAVKEVRGRIVFTDGTAPTVHVPGPISAIATAREGAVVTFAAGAEDDYPGAVAATCLPASGSRFPPGATNVSCIAVDAAGNVGTASFDVTVTFAWSGVLPPLPGATARVGRTVPVKFALTGASSGITDLAATLLPVPAGRVHAGASVPSSSVFRYDPGAGQYVLNLPTGGLAPGRWSLRIALGDGVERTVPITLR